MQTELLPAEHTEIETLPSEKDWLAARRQGIGASEAAAILGVSPFKSALALYAEKLELSEPDATEQEHLYWGRMLERPIAFRYAEVTGRRVVPVPPFNLRRSRAHPFMVATLDALTWPSPESVMPLEIKNVSAYRAEDWETEPPLHYQVQVQHQLAVTGGAMASIAALIGGNRLVWFDVPRNDRFIAKLVLAEAEFWQRLLEKTPPPVDGSESAKALLRTLYPRETPGLVVNLPAEVIEWDAELQQIKAGLAIESTRKDELENRIKAALGEAEQGVCTNGLTYTWKASERKGYTVEPTIVRTLRRKEAK